MMMLVPKPPGYVDVALLQQHPAEILNFPVRADERYAGVALACGLWPLKYILVGKAWFGLTPYEQQAALMHEAGHCTLWHKEIRLLLLPFAWTKWAQKIARSHEFEADAFAVRGDHAFGMLQLMHRGMRAEWSRRDRVGPPTHDEILDRALSPPAEERARHILRLSQGVSDDKLAA